MAGIVGVRRWLAGRRAARRVEDRLQFTETIMTHRIDFDFRSMADGCADYDLRIAGRPIRRVCHQVSAPVYDAQRWTLTRAQFDAQVAGRVGTLTFADGTPVPDDVLSAFNARQRAAHAEYLDWLERFPAVREASGVPAPPVPVATAQWDPEAGGWVRREQTREVA